MKFGFYTFGCKVNQYETQAMSHLLETQGHTVCEFREDCDAYIINTCSVTATADRKNRTLIRRCRQQHPDSIVAVCGCYPQHDPDAAARLGADVIGGSGGREAFLRDVLSALESRRTVCRVDEAMKRRSFEVLPPGGLAGRTRGMLKVQDGCCNFCTYCIIPYTRGPVRSAPPELAVEQARQLSAQGYQEIVITGIEIASWGVDLPGKPTLSLLLEQISRAVPQVRLRLGSLEPRIITEEFCRTLQALPNLCPHFHLSLQSGCDSVLARMKRKYDTARYLESLRLLRSYFPHCAITTDLIVGFPGETEEEFAQTLSFMERCAFADVHIFPYSRRPGTPADKLPGQWDKETKERRSRQAVAFGKTLSAQYQAGLVGTTHTVLFEEQENGFSTGHCPNYVKVYVPGCQDLHGQLREVVLTEVRDGGMLARLADENFC